MGTKRRPGAYDCYGKAEDDEPMFVLLARDPLAPRLVERWAELREATRGPGAKVDEARACAAAMAVWAAEDRREEAASGTGGRDNEGGATSVVEAPSAAPDPPIAVEINWNPSWLMDRLLDAASAAGAHTEVVRRDRRPRGRHPHRVAVHRGRLGAHLAARQAVVMSGMVRRLVPCVAAGTAYVSTVIAANWAVQHYGIVPVGLGLRAPAGVYAAGLAFTLRDLLQGWEPDDYWRCVDLYTEAGVDLAAAPLVALGSVCRRQDTRLVAVLVVSLASAGLRLHGLGLKVSGLRRCGWALTSADSMAWSLDGRLPNGSRCAPDRDHRQCANCLAHALAWRLRLLERISTQQPELWTDGGPGASPATSTKASAGEADPSPADRRQVAPSQVPNCRIVHLRVPDLRRRSPGGLGAHLYRGGSTSEMETMSEQSDERTYTVEQVAAMAGTSTAAIRARSSRGTMPPGELVPCATPDPVLLVVGQGELEAFLPDRTTTTAGGEPGHPLYVPYSCCPSAGALPL